MNIIVKRTCVLVKLPGHTQPHNGSSSYSHRLQISEAKYKQLKYFNCLLFMFTYINVLQRAVFRYSTNTCYLFLTIYFIEIIF